MNNFNGMGKLENATKLNNENCEFNNENGMFDFRKLYLMDNFFKIWNVKNDSDY